MVSQVNIDDLIANVDIYLIDQILKKRYREGEKILDAGCGGGRNLRWFAQNNFELHGVDSNINAINGIENKFPDLVGNFVVGDLVDLPYPDDFFDHIIVSAVLHFAKDIEHYKSMVSELVRVLKPTGSLFIRMASNFGMPENVMKVSEGVYHLPDGSERFLLTNDLLASMLNDHKLKLVEPVKTTNVENKRWMTTLVLVKYS